MNTIPHVVTIKECAKESGLREYTIRRWVQEGKFPVLYAGRRVLINMDIFTAYLSGCFQDAKNEKQFVPIPERIRRV